MIEQTIIRNAFIAIENSLSAIISCNDEGGIIYANTQSANMFGYEQRCDLIGKNVFSLCPSKNINEAKEAFKYASEFTEQKVSNWKTLKKDGSRVNVEVSITNLKSIEYGSDNHKLGFTISFRDTTLEDSLVNNLLDSKMGCKKLLMEVNNSICTLDKCMSKCRNCDKNSNCSHSSGLELTILELKALMEDAKDHVNHVKTIE